MKTNAISCERPTRAAQAAQAALAALAAVICTACSTPSQSSPPVATAAACTATATREPPVRALRFAAAARAEHSAWGGQSLDDHGRLVMSGAYEAEADPHGLGAAPWQRVLGYWHAVDHGARGLPYVVRGGGLWPANRTRLREALEQAANQPDNGVTAGPAEGLSAQDLQTLATVLDRVAVIDTPWSAAFVSWLARDSGLQDDEFQRSEAHADYAGAAWAATAAERTGQATRYAMRACDLTRTSPRVADLVCQTRGAGARLDRYETLGAVLAARPTGGGALPMHCDVVTQVDERGFDAIGGNVLQSVTLRRLAFAPGTRRLDPSYVDGAGCTPGAAGCVERHMSRQPWSLLLQWRE